MDLLEHYKDKYTIETDPESGFKVKVGARMYLPGHFLSMTAANTALKRHLALKYKAEMKRKSSKKAA